MATTLGRIFDSGVVNDIGRQRKALRARVNQNQPLTNADRDLLLLAIAQKLGIISD
jgi:hypothetical protein